MIRAEHAVSIGNFYKHYLHDPLMKSMFECKKLLSPVHALWMQVAAVNLRKVVLTSSEIIPSQSCTCEVFHGVID